MSGKSPWRGSFRRSIRPSLGFDLPEPLVRACYAFLVRWLGVLLGVAVAACGNSRESAEKPAACIPDRKSVRLWTFSLSHPDTVTLKNTSACPVDVGGMELLFDDRDDAFPPETALDCTVRLPPLELEAGASLRVSELPFPGEIDALANEVSGCAYPLSFNPDRGGVTYLCEGACDGATLLDAVAHAGDTIDALEPGVVQNRYRDPPAPRFGARFDRALDGSSKHNDGVVRYQRVTTLGATPDFRANDWGIQSRALYADFEDGVRVRDVQSSPEPWSVVPGEAAEIVTTTETSAWLTASLRVSHHGEDGVSVALATPLDAYSTPRDLAYFVRTSAPDVTAGNLALFAGSNPLVELGFEPAGLGVLDANGKRFEAPADPNVWHRVELRDIDWSTRKFDAYVDGARVGRGITFAPGDAPADELRVYALSAGSTAYFDAVEVWGLPSPIVTGDPSGGLLRCSAATGGEGGAGGVGLNELGAGGAPSGPVCEAIDGPNGESVSCENFCSDWDVICCGEAFAENYANKAECLRSCADFSASELCCRARHGRVGGPERCRYALGLDNACAE